MTEQLERETTARKAGRGEQRTVDVLGIRCEWKVTAEETGQRYAMFEALVPSGAGVPMHSHAGQETFYVLDGQAEFARLGSQGPEWVPAGAGDTFIIPGNVMHGFRNPGVSVSRMLVLLTADLAPFFEEAGVPVAPGAPTPGPPTPEQIERGFAMMRKHGMRFLEAA